MSRESQDAPPRHPFEPVQLPDGRWQVKNVVTAGPCTRISALFFVFRYFYNDPEALVYVFWEIADTIWNTNPDEKLMERHAWSEQIIEDLANNKYAGFGGCGSSGKSHVVSAWGILKWLADPANTIVLITTTALKDADQRVWGSVIRLMTPLMGSIPARERPSLHDYVYQPEGQKMNVSRGIFLVAAEKKKTREAVGRFVGRKAKHIILIADELAELSPAIMNAGVSNLSIGGELSFQAVGMSNPDSRFDAFGEWVEPKDGWESIDTTTDTTWETKWNGWYRRFDSYESPHFSRSKSYLPTEGRVEEAKELLGENSRSYMRMWRAVFFDGSDENGVYSEIELAKSGALNRESAPRITKLIGRVAGVDLGYTWGGDRTMWRAADVGYGEDGRMLIHLHPLEALKEDVNSGEPRAYQIAHSIASLMKKYKIPVRHVCIDATAGGNPICDVVDMVVSQSEDLDSGLKGQCTRVQFGGSPSDLRVNPRVKRTAKDMYRNRVTELWFASKEFFRCRQVYGLDGETAKEMTNREFDQKKVSSGLKIQLESKADYKRRTNMPSPDAADTTFLAIDSARQNFSFFPIEPRKDDDPKGWKSPPPSLTGADVAGQSADSWL